MTVRSLIFLVALGACHFAQAGPPKTEYSVYNYGPAAWADTALLACQLKASLATSADVQNPGTADEGFHCNGPGADGLGGGVRWVCNGASVPWNSDCQPLVIKINGPSRTKALPAGPAILQIVKLTGTAPAGRTVNISMGSGGSVSGKSDSAGQVWVWYMPPRQAVAVDELTATCADCSNTAVKTITVDACDICEGAK